jgi:hypothetical protein
VHVSLYQCSKRLATRSLHPLESKFFRPLPGVRFRWPFFRVSSRELEEQIPLASAYKDLPKGRKRQGWKKDFLRSMQKAAADLGDISEEQILKTVRERRSGRKKLPEITVVARTKKRTA